MIALEDVGQPHSPVTAFTELCALDVHKLVCRNIVRQVQRPLLWFVIDAFNPHKLSLPNDRMEGDVVLPDEVENLGLGVVPPFLPGVGLTGHFGPLNRCGEISHYCFEPYIETLRVPAFKGDGNAPLDITRYRSTLQAPFDEITGEIDHIRSPVAFLWFKVFEQVIGEGR